MSLAFSGRSVIAASRDRTWAFLMDPLQVGRCGPGVRDIEVVDDDHYRMTARIGIGMITSSFRIDATVTARLPPARAVIEVRGQAPGTAVEATAEMLLMDDEAATAMAWTANVRINGKLASLGERLIRGTAEKMIQQTFACIAVTLETAARDAGGMAASSGAD